MNMQISTAAAPAAIGPYSQGVATPGGMVFVSGQLGLVPSTGKLAEGGVEAQARQALANVKAILEAAGCQMSDVVKTTCLLADIADFAKFNVVYDEFFGDGVAPARSAFAVRALPKGALVEIEAIACKRL